MAFLYDLWHFRPFFLHFFPVRKCIWAIMPKRHDFSQKLKLFSDNFLGKNSIILSTIKKLRIKQKGGMRISLLCAEMHFRLHSLCICSNSNWNLFSTCPSVSNSQWISMLWKISDFFKNVLQKRAESAQVCHPWYRNQISDWITVDFFQRTCSLQSSQHISKIALKAHTPKKDGSCTMFENHQKCRIEIFLSIVNYAF